MITWWNSCVRRRDCITISFLFYDSVICILREFRITEQLRLEGTSGRYLVQPHCPSYKKKQLVHPKKNPSWKWCSVSHPMWDGSAIGHIQCRTWYAKASFLGWQQGNNTQFLYRFAWGLHSIHLGTSPFFHLPLSHLLIKSLTTASACWHDFFCIYR